MTTQSVAQASGKFTIGGDLTVANIGYGVAWMLDRWKFAFARYHGTREFEGQQESPVFGSFTIST